MDSRTRRQHKVLRGHRWVRLVPAALLTAATLAAVPAVPAAPAVARPTGPQPVVRTASAFAETPKLRRLDVPESEASGHVSPARPVDRGTSDTSGPGPQALGAREGAAPGSPVPSALTGPSLTFEGLSDDSNQALGFGSLYPPDPTMDVGPQHVVQQTNLALAVYDKSGSLLAGPTKVSDLFSTLPAGNACRVTNNGDPQVLYDHLANRWLVSQFSFPNGSSTPPFHQCVAISQSGNPTGAYFAYDFVMPNDKFNDYAKFGVWPDGYYMTDNQFSTSSSWAGGGAFAFDRLRMLAGDPEAAYVYFDLAASFPTAGGMLPSDLDGAPPAAGTPNTFADLSATEWGNAADGIRTYDFHVDFANPASSTFTATGVVGVPAFDPIDPSGRGDVPQPGTSVGLDSITDRLLQRLQYRIIDGVPHLTTNHTVDVSGDGSAAVFQAGVRIEELTGPTWTLQNSASVAPNTTDRWMGSAALDHAGNLAVGYSASSTGLYPSIYYTGRLASAPTNVLGAEQLMWSGAGSQLGTANRWGDYTQMSVDPSDDCTFWYGNEYYQSSQTIDWHTRIGKFTFPECSPVTTSSITGVVTDASTEAPIAGATVRTSNGYFTRTDGAGTYTLPAVPGTYDLIVSGFGYLTATRNGVTNPSAQDFALTPAVPHALAGTVTYETGGAAPAATVSLGGGISTTTDGAGHYSFPNVPAGDYTLTVTSPSRCSTDASTPVTVDADKTVNVMLPAKMDAFGHWCREITSAYTEASTPVSFTGDDASTSVAIPFAFNFYGTDYTTAYVSSNGHLNFLAASTAFANGALPSAAAPNGAVYPFWDDLYVDSPTAGLYVGTTGEAPNRRFTIEWRNVRFFSPSTSRVDVEVVLVEGGPLEFHYRNLDPGVPAEVGSSATVGIENAAGDDALQYSLNATGSLANARAIMVDSAPFVTCEGLTATITGAGTINGTGGDDVIAGSDGADTIDGGGGNDTICALGDNDTVTDGEGADVVIGGDGDDLFLQGSAVDAGDVLNGGAGVDEVRYAGRTDSVAVTLGGGAADDGGSGEGDQLLGVENARGGSGDDALTGSAAANALLGGAGGDTVIDGGGADVVTGGDGDDLFLQGSTADAGDVLNGGAGVDEVRYASRTDSVTVTLGNSVADDGGTGEGDKLLGVENARGGSGDDALTGSAAANALLGGAGSDTVTDGGGADAVTGGDGDDLFLQGSTADAGDVLNGGAGVDEVRYASRTDSVTVTLGNSVADDGGTGEGDKLLAVENARGGGGDDRLTGSAAANALLGGLGSDTLVDGGGADVLTGGDGDDLFLQGSTADAGDVLNGGAGVDEVRYTSRTGAVTVTLGNSLADDGGSGEGDKLLGVENARGGGGDDVLTGSAVANTLLGGAGADTVNGGGGNDSLVGGTGSDVANGGNEDDVINIRDSVSGNDTANGGAGTDTVTADAGDTVTGVP